MNHLNNYCNFLNEKKSTGVIYHYTTPHGLKMILAQDTMLSGHKHISFSRNYDLTTWYEDYGAMCRISFDGSSMTDKFHIEPYLFDPSKDPLFGGGTVSDVVQRRKFYGSEREEKIAGEKIVGVKKFIIQVDIMSGYVDSKTDLEDINIAKRNNIDINIQYVDKFKPVKIM